MKLFVFILIQLCPFLSFGQDNSDCYVQKDFLILYSSTNYESALKTAKQAANNLNLKLDLRDLIPVPDSDIGLSLPADTCLQYLKKINESDTTCYIARGQWDEGMFISVEYSNAYIGFNKGYYIVMAGSGNKNDTTLADYLREVRRKYSDAYIKTSKMYRCCMY